MKRSISLALATVLVFAVSSNAYSLQSSKPGNQRGVTCKAKLGAKNINKADRKAEWEKCMSNPDDYK